MKRIGLLLALILLLTSVPAQFLSAAAEGAAAGASVSDLQALMDAADIPSTTTLELKAAATGGEARSFSQQLVSSNGDKLNVRFDFQLLESLSEAQWQTVTDWLKSLVLGAVQTVQADSESLANVIAQAYTAQRAAAQPGDTGMPVWAASTVQLVRVSATVPYYPLLGEGVNGAATQQLQEKLIELGFLDDKADGYYGTNTKDAVMRLDRYVQLLAQDRRVSAAQDSAVLTLASGGVTPMPIVADELNEAQETAVMKAGDGSATAMLQAYLYSDRFQAVRGEAAPGDSSIAVYRVQTRLKNLGYLAGDVDGSYGAGTAYSMRIFQYYNGLAQTGIADEATQQVLFSARAVKPDNSMLTVGSSGDAVSTLQRRLRVLGFGSISVDGSYGSTTKSAVENLQKYMQSAGLMGGYAEVNGIADPLVLDAFYAISFPEIPAAMSAGSSGIDVVRLQRRLACLEYYYGTIDGSYGDGTATAVKGFQKLNGLNATGIADTQTLQKLFNANAVKSKKPYLLRVSRADQRVYVYALDGNLEYTNLVKTMKCSTGRNGATETPAGTYTNSTGPGARWHFFTKFNCWAQYAYYIQGDIMFHSVLYNAKEGKVTRSSVNNLGRKASHGCVRLSVEDAQWIWTNCPTHTTVIVE